MTDLVPLNFVGRVGVMQWEVEESASIDKRGSVFKVPFFIYAGMMRDHILIEKIEVDIFSNGERLTEAEKKSIAQTSAELELVVGIDVVFRVKVGRFLNQPVFADFVPTAYKIEKPIYVRKGGNFCAVIDGEIIENITLVVRVIGKKIAEV